MDAERVIVIGAGPAGLAAGAALARAGVPATLLERGEAVGTSWRGRYDRLRLNTSRRCSKLPGARYARGTPLFPSRDHVVSYLEDYASQNDLDVRFGVEVERVDRADDDADGARFTVRTPEGELPASHVIVATGFEHTPVMPDWPGAEAFAGELIHAAAYRNAEPYRGREVLVIGPGCSGVEIAYDLAEGGAGRVRLAVRTPPSLLLRQQGGVPGDVPARLLMRLPTRLADAQVRLVGRLAIGDLSEFGLPAPEAGAMTRLKQENKAPAIVDKPMVDAIRDGRIEVVAGVTAFEGPAVALADGGRIKPDAVIAATGYSTGLEPLVGHLGVLDDADRPRVSRGEEAAPGLRFVGYVPRPGQIGDMGAEARRAARAIARRERTATATAPAAATA